VPWHARLPRFKGAGASRDEDGACPGNRSPFRSAPHGGATQHQRRWRHEGRAHSGCRFLHGQFTGVARSRQCRQAAPVLWQTRCLAVRKQAQFSHGMPLWRLYTHTHDSTRKVEPYDHWDKDAGLTVLLLYQDPDCPPEARAHWYHESRKELVPIHGAFAEIFNGRMYHGVIPAYR
jgi:hypothetical protein